jgi:hypothetical protein
MYALSTAMSRASEMSRQVGTEGDQLSLRESFYEHGHETVSWWRLL